MECKKWFSKLEFKVGPKIFAEEKAEHSEKEF